MPVLELDWQAPRWEIELADGSLLSPSRKVLISTITCTASIDGADELVLQCLAMDPDDRTLRFLGEDILKPGNRVVFWAGYGAEIKALQRFRIARHNAQFSAGSAPTVTIRGYSAEADLVDTTKARAWPGPARDSDIVADIADEHGLDYDDETLQRTHERPEGRVKKKGTSDLEFLQQLAIANGYGPPVIRYDADKNAAVLYFRVYSLSYQADLATFRHDPYRAGSDDVSGTLESFTASVSLAGVPTLLEVTGWNEAAQEPIKILLEMTANGQRSQILTGQDQVGKVDERVRSGAELQVAVVAAGTSRTGEQREVVSTRTVKTTEDALSWAERWFATRQRAYMEGRYTVVGWQGLWAPQIHRFEGLAPEFDGLWELQTCRHTFDQSGYRCSGDVVPILEESAPTETSE